MQGKYLFEYAVIRVVPKVEREEFLNAGVILYCAQKKFLDVIYKLDKERLKCFAVDTDITEIEESLKAIEQICKGNGEGGAIGKLDLASRFRWITATRSTVVQASKVHPGFTHNPDDTLKRLFENLILITNS